MNHLQTSLSLAQQNAFQQKRLFVNNPSYDNVGQILKRMGPGFEFQPATNYQSVPPEQAILFLNCGGYSPASPKGIREFIERGGTVYASDIQASFLTQVFPEVFRKTPGTCFSDIMIASVMDQGLAELIGHSITLTFDVSPWQYLVPSASFDKKVQVHLAVCEDNQMVAIPLVLSYEVSVLERIPI